MFGQRTRQAFWKSRSGQTRPGLGALDLFQNALRAYGNATQSNGQAWLLEPVIRASRGIAANPERLEKQDKVILLSIKSRYHAFARGRELPELGSYADAHTLMRTLFF